MSGWANDIHALSGAYAVDALDDEERALFEEHLTVCAACRAEVDSLREASAVLGELSSAPPPASLRDDVLAGIRSVRPLPPSRSEADAPVSLDARRRRRLAPAALLAAASVVAAVGVGVAVVEPWQDEPTTQVGLTAAERVLVAEDAVRSDTIRFPGGAEASVVHSASEHRAVLVTSDMPPAPENRVYALWLQSPDGEMLPAGVMPRGPDQLFVLEGDPTEAMAVGITVEPAGGSLKPTTTPIALFDLQTT